MTVLSGRVTGGHIARAIWMGPAYPVGKGEVIHIGHAVAILDSEPVHNTVPGGDHPGL